MDNITKLYNKLNLNCVTHFQENNHLLFIDSLSKLIDFLYFNSCSGIKVIIEKYIDQILLKYFNCKINNKNYQVKSKLFLNHVYVIDNLIKDEYKKLPLMEILNKMHRIYHNSDFSAQANISDEALQINLEQGYYDRSLKIMACQIRQEIFYEPVIEIAFYTNLGNLIRNYLLKDNNFDLISNDIKSEDIKNISVNPIFVINMGILIQNRLNYLLNKV